MNARPPSAPLPPGPRRQSLSRWLVVIGIGWILLGFPRTASAHPFLQNTWSVLVQTNRILMRVTGSVREVAASQGLALTPGTLELDAITGALPGHAEHLLEHLDVLADGNRLDGFLVDCQLLAEAEPELPGVADPLTEFERTRVGFDLEHPLPPGGPPGTLTLSQRVLADHPYAPGIPWDVTYTLEVRDGQRQVLARDLVGRDRPVTVRVAGSAAPGPGAPDPGMAPGDAAASGIQEVPPEPGIPGWPAFLRLGVHHVLTGYDHLLFLAGLALAARRVMDLMKILLLFTLAHSVTVTLAALGWVRAPAGLVEPVIAGSIVVVALHNVFRPETARGPVRLAMAFGFGLVHGLGFAGGLSDTLGDPTGWALAAAIAAFCVGVELGHLAVAAPAFGLLAGLRRGRQDGEDFLLRPGSLLVAGGGAYFLWAALRAAV